MEIRWKLSGSWSRHSVFGGSSINLYWHNYIYNIYIYTYGTSLVNSVCQPHSSRTFKDIPIFDIETSLKQRPPSDLCCSQCQAEMVSWKCINIGCVPKFTLGLTQARLQCWVSLGNAMGHTAIDLGQIWCQGISKFWPRSNIFDSSGLPLRSQ